MSQLALYLLGSPRVKLGGEPVHIGRSKAVALLAYLAVEPRRHGRDGLTTLLWPEYDQSSARAELRRTLSLLRRVLGKEWLLANRKTAALDPDADLWLDVNQLRRLLAACDAHGHPETDVCSECVPPLEEAVGLYRDDFMAGFTLRDSLAFDEWQFFQTEGLRQELALTLKRLVRAYYTQAAYEAAIPHARRWLALDPLHEPAHRQLMALYAHSGQQSAALRQYRIYQETLAEELGLSPSPEMTALHERIRAGEEMGQEREVTPRVPHNLPAQLTPFLGRREMLSQISQRMSVPTARLLTLVGVGGMGKTRLAIEAASLLLREHREGFPDGIFFVPLALLSDPASIATALAQSIDFNFYQGQESPEQQLVGYLSEKQMLLVLDNFEHLIDHDSVRLLTRILATAPGIKMLITSRARLNIQGEYVFPLDGLEIPARDEIAQWQHPPEHAVTYSGIQLFLHSARRLKPGFELSPDNLMPIADICLTVQGMPLAIELAAGWVAALEPYEIASEIDQSLDILRTDAGNVPERQQSLRAAFDTSWNLLTEQERLAVQHLAVFRGGFDRTGAERGGKVSLETLLTLVNKSWIQQTAGGRYEVHDLLRRYGQEKLERDPVLESAVRDQHSRYYCDWLRQQEQGTWGAQQQTVLAAIEGDIANVRAACKWAATQGRLRRLGQTVNALGLFYYEWRRSTQVGASTFRELAEALGAVDGRPAAVTASGPHTLAGVLGWQATFYGLIGDVQSEKRLLREGLALLDGPALAGEDTRFERAHIAWQSGYLLLYTDPATSRQRFSESLELYQEIDYDWGVAEAQLGLGRAVREVGALEEAERALTSSLALHREMGNRYGESETLSTLGGLAIRQARFEEAERLIQHSLAITPENDCFGIAFGLKFLGQARLYAGRFAEAEAPLRECIARHKDLGMRGDRLHSRAWLTRVYLHAGKHRAARAQAGRIISRAQALEDHAAISFGLTLLGELALFEAAFAQAYQHLEANLDSLKQYTIGPRQLGGLAWLGLAAWGLDRRAEARQHLLSALDWASKAQQFMQLMVALAGSARLLADTGNVERAIELYALASRHPFVANSRWFEAVVGRYVSAAAASLPPEVVQAARERGQSRDLDATVAELLQGNLNTG